MLSCHGDDDADDDDDDDDDGSHTSLAVGGLDGVAWKLAGEHLLHTRWSRRRKRERERERERGTTNIINSPQKDRGKKAATERAQQKKQQGGKTGESEREAR